MSRRVFSLLLCILLLTGCAVQLPSLGDRPVCEFTDDTGACFSMPIKPKKVAVLTSSLADLWITAGGHVDITVGETVERGFTSIRF